MALPNDVQRISEGLAKLEAANPNYSSGTAAKAAARRLIRRQIVIGQIAASNANGVGVLAANAQPGFVPDVAGRVLKCTGYTDTAVTAAGGNNATISLVPIVIANGAASASTIATVTTNTAANGGSGNITVGIPFDVPIVVANARYTAGQPLAPVVVMNSSGVALGKVTFTITVEEESTDTYPV